MQSSFNYTGRLRSIYVAIATLAFSLAAIAQSHAQVGVPNAWGSNQYGQLGDGGANNVASAEQISKLSAIIQIAGGGGHSLALKSGGTVWTWGHNDGGQLGNGTTVDKSVPTQILAFKRVAQIAAGDSHSLVLKADGTVWAWGLNTKGQVGDGTFVSKSAPVKVSGLTRIVQVAAGAFHSLALKTDGTVWVWGANDSGQLGIADRKHRNTPVQVTTLKGVVQVAGGDYHSMALKTDGTVWAWGTNNAGQLGDGTNFNFRISPNKVVNLTGVAQISSGAFHALALKFDGTVWAWGLGTAGELGNGGLVDSNVPVQSSGISAAVQVAGGGNHSLALLADGTVQAWGENTSGELGDGSATNHNLPVPVANLASQTYISAGASHSFSLTAVLQDVKATSTALTQQYGKAITLLGSLHNSVTGLPLLQAPAGFNLNGVDLGVGYTDASGKALFIAPAPTQYTVGTYPIIVNLSGNGLYNAARSAQETLTITKADTGVLCPAITSVYGQKAPLLATLRRKTDGAKLATKTIVYKLDGVKIGTADTDGRGRATLLYRIADALTLGVHTLEASYEGDDNHNASTVKSTLTINKSPATILVNAVTGGYGKTVALIGLLRRSSDKLKLPNQTLGFKIDGASVGTAVTNSKGVAALNYKIEEALASGAHAIEVSFAGDGKTNASTGSATLTVSKADTALLMSSSIAQYGQTVNLLATLNRETDKAKLANQAVVFLIDDVQAGQATTDSKGRATIAYTVDDNLAPGSHTVKADFAGTNYYNPSTLTTTLTVNQATTKVSVASAAGSIGETVNLVAKLKRNTDAKALGSKTIHYLVEGKELGTADTDATGVATLSFTIPSTMAKGKHKVVVVFSGDSYYLTSKFDTATLTVN